MSNDVPALQPLCQSPLPLGTIKPRGWLARQLRIQADGLSGHLDEFWPDVADSGWLGGAAEGWERGPYWLDGVVPLAYLLDDEGLIAKVQRWVDYVLEHQHDDGWLGPVKDQKTDQYEAYDAWPVFVFLKALMQYETATGDARVLPAMARFLHRLEELLAERPLFGWGAVRWADLALVIHWLYERTGEAWLLELAETLHAQGFDWGVCWAVSPYTERSAPEDIVLSDEALAAETRPIVSLHGPFGNLNLITHVVNNAMGIKQPGVWFRQSGDAAEIQAALRMIDELDRYHGQASGVFTGDEHLAGCSPSQGTELCAVVEYMYSLEVLAGVSDDPRIGDRLEQIAYNALPATFKPDMWAHQYVQQANQVVVQMSPERVYTNNGPDSNIFGLEPNYGCCTANMHQGWPKFVEHLWLRTADGGLAALAYAPCELRTEIGGVPVTLLCETDYPFEETVRLTVTAESATCFPLALRVPAWAQAPTLLVDGEKVALTAGSVHRVEREWCGETRIELRLPMKLAVTRRYNDAVSLRRGPLVYGLRIGESWEQIGGELPHGDWEVLPTTPWNYGIALDLDAPEASVSFRAGAVGDCPFSPKGAPIVAHAKGRLLPAWGLERNAAAPPPQSPVVGKGPLVDLELIPYGCTNLRVTEFPLLEKKQARGRTPGRLLYCMS